MPAIRSSSWAATAVATGTTLVIPMPVSVAGDLLLAVFMADTGAAVWTSAGWTHAPGSPSTNTSQLAVMWRIAGASEPASYTFTASISESYNGAILSIRDVNQSNPFGVTPVVSFANQAAAAKFNFPTITTNTANSLILYAYANSGIGVPSVIEGPAFGLVAADGLAESIGIGWGFQAAVGVTPANVGCSNVATGAGRVLVLQIAPPLTGAAVIPAYCASDASLYIDPINGVTAYNGNTAIAATADTGFSTALGGLTAADAAVALITDVGLNSFHSAARITSISGSVNMSGVELVLATANKPNVAGKNVMLHIGPSSEGQVQRFSSVSSGRGLWFGMRSAAASAWKIWQAYGSERGSLRQQPIVINSSAPNVKSANGTLDASSVLAFGVWISGTGVTTTIWDVCSLWALDTTTVCGGNAAEPVGIVGIVESAATGHERKSVLLQGSKQMLSYQPLQLGNGGTSPLNLDLDATAIEFPRLYNSATAEVTYNSVPNVAGLTYYPGAGDPVKHTNAVISSASPYHWRIHPSASESASYNFDGLTIIGAGDVQLRPVTTFSGMAFNACPTIYPNAARLASCAFKGSKIFSATLGNMSNIAGCQFTSAGTGHAIEVGGTAGAITLTGDTFTGYAASNGSTGNEAIFVNIATGAVTINVSGGGNTPSIRTAGATVTVNNSVTLTLTGLQTGSDIVILSAGTNTVLAQADQNSGSTYSYSFSTGGSVDIGVFKAGYVTHYARNYTLPASNSSLPFAQVADRNYS